MYASFSHRSMAERYIRQLFSRARSAASAHSSTVYLLIPVQYPLEGCPWTLRTRMHYSATCTPRAPPCAPPHDTSSWLSAGTPPSRLQPQAHALAAKPPDSHGFPVATGAPPAHQNPQHSSLKQATQPPCCHPHHRRAGPRRPLAARAALLPVRIAHGVFGLACRATLGPLRAVLGQKIPLSNRRHLICMPERLEVMLGGMQFAQVRPYSSALDRLGHLNLNMPGRETPALWASTVMSIAILPSGCIQGVGCALISTLANSSVQRAQSPQCHCGKATAGWSQCMPRMHVVTLDIFPMPALQLEDRAYFAAATAVRYSAGHPDAIEPRRQRRAAGCCRGGMRTCSWWRGSPAASSRPCRSPGRCGATSATSPAAAGSLWWCSLRRSTPASSPAAKSSSTPVRTGRL